MSLILENLNKCFDSAFNEEAKYIGVLIAVKDSDTYKTVVSSASGFVSEQKFYNETYNEDLTHKYSEGLRIVGFTQANSFFEIEEALFGFTNEDKVIVDDDEVAKFVYEKTGIDKKTILQVFDAEMEYLNTLGIVEGE